MKKFTTFQLFKYNSLNIKVGETFPFTLVPINDKRTFAEYMKSYFASESLFSLITVKVCQSRNADEIVLVPDDKKDMEFYKSVTLKTEDLKFLLVKGVGIYQFFK